MVLNKRVEQTISKGSRTINMSEVNYYVVAYGSVGKSVASGNVSG